MMSKKIKEISFTYKDLHYQFKYPEKISNFKVEAIFEDKNSMDGGLIFPDFAYLKVKLQNKTARTMTYAFGIPPQVDERIFAAILDRAVTKFVEHLLF